MSQASKCQINMLTTIKASALKLPPIHQWTHDGSKVLLVKCVNNDGTSRGGFQWPESGPVESPNWDGKPTCEGGGLFGWPWALHIGVGKHPDFTKPWIVYAADPQDVLGNIEGEPKAKARKAHVVYYGAWPGAMKLTQAGRLAWVKSSGSG